MKFDDFLKALDDSGWQGVSDAQHTHIKDLHKRLFPVIAELEEDVFQLDCIVNP